MHLWWRHHNHVLPQLFTVEVSICKCLSWSKCLRTTLFVNCFSDLKNSVKKLLTMTCLCWKRSSERQTASGTEVTDESQGSSLTDSRDFTMFPSRLRLGCSSSLLELSSSREVIWWPESWGRWSSFVEVICVLSSCPCLDSLFSPNDTQDDEDVVVVGKTVYGWQWREQMDEENKCLLGIAGRRETICKENVFLDKKRSEGLEKGSSSILLRNEDNWLIKWGKDVFSNHYSDLNDKDK